MFIESTLCENKGFSFFVTAILPVPRITVGFLN